MLLVEIKAMNEGYCCMLANTVSCMAITTDRPILTICKTCRWRAQQF